MNTRHRTSELTKPSAVPSTSKSSLGTKKTVDTPSTSKNCMMTRKRILDPPKCKKPCTHRAYQYKKSRKGQTELVVKDVDDPIDSYMARRHKDDLWETKEARRQDLIFFINVKMSLEYQIDEQKRACSAWSTAREVETHAGNNKVLKNHGVRWLALKKPHFRGEPRRKKHRQEIPESIKDSDKIKFFSWYNDGRRAEQSTQAIMMAKVTPDPPMTHWVETTMNYRVEDGKFLVHYPYLGEDVCDQDFENELYESYGKVDHKSLKQTTMPDEVFFQTVIRYEKQFLLKQKNPCTSKTGGIDLTRQNKCGQVIPSRFIFTDVATAFPFLGFPFELERRFARIVRNQPGLAEQSKIDPTGANSDEGLKLAISAKEAKHKYEKHFCRRCLLYSCITHDEDDHVDPKYINYTRLNEPLTGIKCSHADCVKISVPKNVDKSLCSDWTPAEMSLCKILMEISKEAYCHMSSILTTKTCREVSAYYAKPKVYKFCNSEMGQEEYEYANESPQKKSPVKPSTSQPVTGDDKATFVAQQARIEILKSGKPKFIPKNWSSGEDCPHYIPCLHSDGGYCDEKSNCSCFNRGGHCEKYCSCAADCIRRFKGCKCKNDCSTIVCPCYKANRECDPSLCRQCGSENVTPVDGKCKNVGILYQWEKQIELKKSNVAGWGGFTPCDIKKWELIAEYRGELISPAESARRALYYDKIQHTYLFALNEDLVIDATRVGSKVRFLNSSTRPNCVPKIMMVNGDHRIGIYADKSIKAGEELFFDYEHVIRETIKNKKKNKGKGKSKVA